MHSEHSSYLRFASLSRMEKAVNSLLGIVEGISVDAHVNPKEIAFLEAWIEDHREVQAAHPFNELIPVLNGILEDGIITDDEKQDLLWLCERLRSAEFVGAATADMQRLHAILGGIAADGVITTGELEGLSDWLAQHEHLKTLWPYDEVDSLITAALRDRKIDDEEHRILLNFFREFTSILDEKTITNPLLFKEASIVGLCAVCPEIQISGMTFCFTGASSKYTRSTFSEVIQTLGGTVLSNVSQKLNYLVIGSDGNPCWSYACYGRKVEKAVELRKKGARLMIIHENDFHDTVIA